MIAKVVFVIGFVDAEGSQLRFDVFLRLHELVSDIGIDAIDAIVENVCKLCIMAPLHALLMRWRDSSD